MSVNERKLHDVTLDVAIVNRELNRLVKLIKGIEKNGSHFPTNKITAKMALLGAELEPLLEEQRLLSETIKVQNL